MNYVCIFVEHNYHCMIFTAELHWEDLLISIFHIDPLFFNKSLTNILVLKGIYFDWEICFSCFVCQA